MIDAIMFPATQGFSPQRRHTMQSVHRSYFMIAMAMLTLITATQTTFADIFAKADAQAVLEAAGSPRGFLQAAESGKQPPETAASAGARPAD